MESGSRVTLVDPTPLAVSGRMSTKSDDGKATPFPKTGAIVTDAVGVATRWAEYSVQLRKFVGGRLAGLSVVGGSAYQASSRLVLLEFGDNAELIPRGVHPAIVVSAADGTWLGSIVAWEARGVGTMRARITGAMVDVPEKDSTTLADDLAWVAGLAYWHRQRALGLAASPSPAPAAAAETPSR